MSKSLETAKQFLGKEVEVVINRPLGSRHPDHGFLYEVNYGYIQGVKAPDGEDLDAYYLGATNPIEKGKGECVAIVHRNDNDDDKLVVVTNGFNPTDEEILRLVDFQENRYDHELIR